MVDLNLDDERFETTPVFYFINYINVIHNIFFHGLMS